MIKFNSYTWFKALHIPENFVIDADGWDRENYEASMQEMITLDEFVNRLSRCTANWFANLPFFLLALQQSHQTELKETDDDQT